MKKLNLIEEFGNNSKKNSIKNVLINADNLEALTLLKKKLENKIELIYIDPPYNTGKKMGKYKDNYKTHSAWIEFMRPRLELAKNMLTQTGKIFISIGENEEAYLKILCNEIFGEENKISSIIWQCNPTVSNDKVGISTQTEYILAYAKSIKDVIINNDPLKEEYIKKTYKNIDNDPRGLWRGGVQLFKKKNKNSYTVYAPNGKPWTMPWNYSEERWHNHLEANNLIYWGKDGNSCPVKKVFLKDTAGTPIKNLWLGEEVGFTSDGGNTIENMFGNRNDFLYPKPVSLMKRILKIGAAPNCLVMDFFAGSGTMGHAVLETNIENNTEYNFILITNDEDGICTNTTLPRLKKVIEGYIGADKTEFKGTDGKVKFFNIANS